MTEAEDKLKNTETYFTPSSSVNLVTEIIFSLLLWNYVILIPGFRRETGEK